MEQQCALLVGEHVDNCDPHGYYKSTERQKITIQSPTKRSFLKECIRQIYILQNRGGEFLASPRPTHFNRSHIWRTLNLLMRPARRSTFEESLERVKRKLFRDSKPKSHRKQLKPQKDKGNRQMEVLHFRSIRYSLGYRNVRRNYLQEARRIVEQEIRLGCTYNAEECVTYVSTSRDDQVSRSQICLCHRNNTHKHTFRELPLLEALQRDHRMEFGQFSRRANKLLEFLRNQQHRERQRMHENILEETIRSIYYVKSLFRLMFDIEKNICV